jgi:putative flippase GtrA
MRTTTKVILGLAMLPALLAAPAVALTAAYLKRDSWTMPAYRRARGRVQQLAVRRSGKSATRAAEAA